MAGFAAWMRDLRKLATKYHATVEKTGGDHIRLRLPNGRMVFCSATPSDHRSLKNTRALLRRESAKPTCANVQR